MKIDQLEALADFVMKESRKAEQERAAKKPRYRWVLPGIGSNVAAALELLVAGSILAGGIYLFTTMGSSAPQPPASYQKPPELSSRAASAKPDSGKRAEKSAKELPVKTAEPAKKPSEPVVDPVFEKEPVGPVVQRPVAEKKPEPVVEKKPAVPVVQRPAVEKNPEPASEPVSELTSVKERIISEYERVNPLFLELINRMSGYAEKIRDVQNKGLNEIKAVEKERTDFIESYFSNLEKEKRIKGWVRNIADMKSGQEKTDSGEDFIFSNSQEYYVELHDGSLCKFSFNIHVGKNKFGIESSKRFFDSQHFKGLDAGNSPCIPGAGGIDSDNKTNNNSLEKKVQNPIESRPYVEFVKVNFPKYSCRIPKSEANALASLQNRHNAFSSTEKDEGDTYVDYLGFYSKRLERIPDEVYKFPHLKTLNLDWNELESADGLEKITSLKYVDVRHNRFRSLESFCAIPGLQLLDARGNPLDPKTLPEEKQKLAKKGVTVIVSDEDYELYFKEKPKVFPK